jgi:UPF0755 protein
VPQQRPQAQARPSPQATLQRPSSVKTKIAPEVITPPVKELLPVKPKASRKRLVLWVTGCILFLLICSLAGIAMWYNMQLAPVSPNDSSRTRIEITSGSSPSQIGQLLQAKKLIRNALVFDIYTKLSNSRSQLQAGTYSLSPSESMQTIVNHLVLGKIDQFSITFLPGATLAENRTALIKAGYSATDVDEALGKTYASPLFQDKPAGTDLEGYIYGETYNFDSNATVEEILNKTFDEFYAEVQKNNLIEEFKKQNLTLYQGITLASIIQREVPHAVDQKHVAQIFLKRLAIGMPLGSDVTYQYAAKKLGITPSPTLDSPYNTRKVTGLPPGPIAAPGASALEAVAHPAVGDYLFFLSGDDDITYYATTDAEHEANIRDHCKLKCSLP